MGKIQNKGVAIQASTTSTGEPAYQITLTLKKGKIADFVLPIIQEAYSLALIAESAPNVSAVAENAKGYTIDKKVEVMIRKMLPKLKHRIERNVDWVALYQTMVRMGLMKPVDFFTWLKWINPICQTVLGKMAVPMSSARKLNPKILDCKVEWDAEALANGLTDEKTSHRAAKSQVTRISNKMDALITLLSKG